jgi:hypothetical protein
MPMRLPPLFGPKQFFCECTGVPANVLLQCVEQALAAVPTAGNSAGILASGKWERWKTRSTAVPLRLHGNRDDGRVFPLVGEEFSAETRYGEELAAATRKFRNQGVLSLECRAGAVMHENRTRLSLLFCDYPGPPMWRARIAETAVYETVRTVGQFLRLRVFGPNSKAVLNLKMGGWAHPDTAHFGTQF